MKLDDRTKGLIAVGASITANCQPCLESTIAMALGGGADEQEVAEAIQVGRMVRKGAAAKMDKFAAGLDPAGLGEGGAAEGGCGCSS